MLAGAVLGARRGFLAVLLLLVLVAVGLPLLAGGRGGLGVFATPSVGFLLGWPVAALVIGWPSERGGAGLPPPRGGGADGVRGHLVPVAPGPRGPPGGGGPVRADGG